MKRETICSWFKVQFGVHDERLIDKFRQTNNFTFSPFIEDKKVNIFREQKETFNRILMLSRPFTAQQCHMKSESLATASSKRRRKLSGVIFLLYVYFFSEDSLSHRSVLLPMPFTNDDANRGKIIFLHFPFRWISFLYFWGVGIFLVACMIR